MVPTIARLVTLVCVGAGCASSEGVSGPEPKTPTIVITECRDYILEPVRFERDSVALEDGRPVLRYLVDAIKAHPEDFALIDIEGNASADETSGDAIALERAKRVRDALVAAGVSSAQLQVRGLGAHCPIDDRSEMNRRVEFRVVRTSHGETGAQVGCDAAK